MTRLAPMLLLLFSLLGFSTFARGQNSGNLFSSAVEAQQAGDYETAIQDYQEILKLHPRMMEARSNLGTALAHEQRFDEAIAQYRLALSVAPGDDVVRKDMAIAFYKKSDLKNAYLELKRVYTAAPKDSQIAILLGDTEVRLGHPAEAAVMLAPMEPANAANSDFEYVFGTALIRSGKHREGADRLEKVAQTTHSADAYLLAGSTLLDLNELKRSREDLEEALQLNPNLPRVHILTGMARDLDGDADAAEPVLREGLRRDPNDFDGNLYLGSILYKRRDMVQSKVYLDRAVQLNPSNPTAGYEMAMWQNTSGNYAEAAKILEALVKSNPDWLQPHIELATVYYHLHRPADGAKERAVVEQLKAQQQTQGPPKLQQP